jgi:hypothetical protein
MHGSQGGAFDEDFVMHARKVFDSYDSRGLGRLDRQEAKLAWAALLGSRPSLCEWERMLMVAEPRPGSYWG